jgi:hypothetical protein
MITGNKEEIGLAGTFRRPKLGSAGDALGIDELELEGRLDVCGERHGDVVAVGHSVRQMPAFRFPLNAISGWYVNSHVTIT